MTPPPPDAPSSPGSLSPGVPGLGAVLREHLVTRLPSALRGGRVALGRRAVVGLALVALLAVVVAVLLVLRGRPAAVPVDDGPMLAPTAPVAPAATPNPTARATAAPDVVVDVAGRVRRPGVHRLPPGARVIDALRAAGGALPGVDLADLAQARRLVDGEQVRVGLLPPPPGAASATGGTGATGGMGTGSRGAGTAAGGDPSAESPLDLNAATVEQLDGLPGVGPVLAQRILDWRQAHGRFARVEELKGVSGLGGKRFASLAPLLRV